MHMNILKVTLLTLNYFKNLFSLKLLIEKVNNFLDNSYITISSLTKTLFEIVEQVDISK